MKRKRFTEEQIIGVLKEAAAGAKTLDLCPRHGREQTLCRWKAKYGGLEVAEVRRLRQLEDENGRPRIINLNVVRAATAGRRAGPLSAP